MLGPDASTEEQLIVREMRLWYYESNSKTRKTVMCSLIIILFNTRRTSHSHANLSDWPFAMADFRVYDRVITDEEIVAIFNP